MKRRDIAVNAGLATVLTAFILNMLEEGYLQFPDLRPIAETQLAKIVEGDTKGCLTSPSQTNVVSSDQAFKLEGKTTRQVLGELGNYFCEGKKGAIRYVKFITDSGKSLYIQIDKSLDEPVNYGFNAPTAATAPTAEAGRDSNRVPVQVPREPQSERGSLEKR